VFFINSYFQRFINKAEQQQQQQQYKINLLGKCHERNITLGYFQTLQLKVDISLANLRIVHVTEDFFQLKSVGFHGI